MGGYLIDRQVSHFVGFPFLAGKGGGGGGGGYLRKQKAFLFLYFSFPGRKCVCPWVSFFSRLESILHIYFTYFLSNFEIKYKQEKHCISICTYLCRSNVVLLVRGKSIRDSGALVAPAGSVPVIRDICP